MKRFAILLSAIFLVFILVYVSGCTTTPEETCEQDEICTGKTVTACCNADECFYEFNGVKYGDDAQSVANLAAALGCAQGNTPTYKEDMGNLILRLQALGEIAKARQ